MYAFETMSDATWFEGVEAFFSPGDVIVEAKRFHKEKDGRTYCYQMVLIRNQRGGRYTFCRRSHYEDKISQTKWRTKDLQFEKHAWTLSLRDRERFGYEEQP